jgi:hypothetical protein
MIRARRSARVISSGESLRVAVMGCCCCIDMCEAWLREDMEWKDVSAMSLDGEGWAAAIGSADARGASSGMGALDARVTRPVVGVADWTRESRAASVSDVVPMRERILSLRTSSKVCLARDGEGARTLSRGRVGEATSSCDGAPWSDACGTPCPAMGESTGAARSGERIEELVDVTRDLVSGDSSS